VPTARAALATRARARKGSPAGGDSPPRARARSRVASRVESAGRDARLRGGPDSTPRSAPAPRVARCRLRVENHQAFETLGPADRFPCGGEIVRAVRPQHHARPHDSRRTRRPSRSARHTSSHADSISSAPHSLLPVAREDQPSCWHPRTNNDRPSSSDCLPT
jgi:hypothetical protein